jgi:hypothetical protein
MMPLRQLRWRALAGPAIVLLAAAIAVAPQLVRGNSCGHDFDFHLVSWFDCFNSWRHGTLYPHWTPSANFGAGEPRFVFYPPLTWMLGAALSLVLPWQFVPIALTFLLLAGTGLATRALARQAFDNGAATLAGCAAIFSGYALFTAYERTAFGELAGGIWLPLLLLFALRDRNSAGTLWRRSLDGSAALLALIVAACWLSNVPVGIMGCYLLAASALVAALLARSGAPVLRAAIGATLGTAVAGLYLLPAAWEQRWVDVRQAISDPGLLIENGWLFARHSDPALVYHDIELRKVSIIALSMVAVALAGLFVCWLRGALKDHSSSPAVRRWWISLALIPLAILFLQFPVSLPLWNLLPKLRFLQFPWRWLVALEAPMAILVAAALWPRKFWLRVAVVALCASFFVSATFYAGQIYFQSCDEQDSVSGMLVAYRNGAGFEGYDEYEPPGTDNSTVTPGLPDACLVSDPATVLGALPNGSEADESVPVWSAAQGSCEATFRWQFNEPEHKRLVVTIDSAGDSKNSPSKSVVGVPAHPHYLILRLRSYPAWRIADTDYTFGALPRREDGLIVVPVPQGQLDLTADWITTPDVVAGRWLSVLAVLLLTALWTFERRLNRLQ